MSDKGPNRLVLNGEVTNAPAPIEIPGLIRVTNLGGGSYIDAKEIVAIAPMDSSNYKVQLLLRGGIGIVVHDSMTKVLELIAKARK